MGRFKEKGHEGIRELQERTGEASDVGQEMIEQAGEINSILEGIDLQDEEDVQGIEQTGKQMQSSFDTAYTEKVEKAGEEIRDEGEQLKESMGEELENVRSGISQLEQAGGVSEIGREAADAGKGRLEQSAGEYEGIISDAEGVLDEAQQKIEQMKGDLGNIFG